MGRGTAPRVYWSPLRGRDWRARAPRYPLESSLTVGHPFSVLRSARSSPGKGERVNRPPSKPFRCDVVSETVTISLRRRTPFGGKGELFVRCSEVDCQYVDANEPPCPLTLDLFAAEVQEREAPRRESR